MGLVGGFVTVGFVDSGVVGCVLPVVVGVVDPGGGAWGVAVVWAVGPCPWVFWARSWML